MLLKSIIIDLLNSARQEHFKIEHKDINEEINQVLRLIQYQMRQDKIKIIK